MLQQFTWQQFLIAALILSFIWYMVILLLFYRKWLTGTVRKRQRNRRPSIRSTYDPREEKADPDAFQDDAAGLMGKPALPEGVSEAETGTFSFASKETGPAENSYSDRDDRLGLVPDVIQELKILFRILEKDGATKDDFISLFELISTKYRGIKGSSSQRYLNEFIRENLPFDLTHEELDKLWQ